MNRFADLEVESLHNYEGTFTSSTTIDDRCLTPPTSQHYLFQDKPAAAKSDKLATYSTPPVSPPWQNAHVGSRRFDPSYAFDRGMDSESRYRSQYRNSGYPTDSIIGSSGQQLPLSSHQLPPSSRPEISGAPGGQNVQAYAAYPYTSPSTFASSTNTAPSAPYSQDYSDSPSRQQPTQEANTQQQYPYPQSMVYSTGQQPPSQYHSMTPYSQRQTGSVDITNQYGTPYYAPGEAPTGGVQSVPSQYIGAQMDSSPYQQTPSGSRSSLQGQYGAGMSQFDPSLGAGQTTQISGGQQGADDAFQGFQSAIARTFEHISQARVEPAARDLINITKWLGDNVTSLGLTRDQADLYADRLELWRNFNYCWLALGEKQRELIEHSKLSNQRPRNLLNLETVQRLGDTLRDLCDQLESHGLVDWELGIWEEEILGIFGVCRAMLTDESTTGGGPSSARASTSRP